MMTGAQLQGHFGPFRRHQRRAGWRNVAPCLLEAAVPLSLCVHRALIRGRSEGARGQGVSGCVNFSVTCRSLF
uniref:Uncharacterized protein n=1 Tax=Poecilia reticulata TaxID=8081 RepID=A0A3P9NB35_POERE